MQIKNKKSGFIQIIILIVLALVVMKFFDITISDAVNWFKTFFQDVLK